MDFDFLKFFYVFAILPLLVFFRLASKVNSSTNNLSIHFNTFWQVGEKNYLSEYFANEKIKNIYKYNSLLYNN
jgi:hypothetical protein